MKAACQEELRVAMPKQAADFGLMPCFAKIIAYTPSRRMKILFKLFGLISLLASTSIIPLHAEENSPGSITTPLSSTTVSGYVGSPVQIVNVPPSAYKTWLI